MAFNATDTHFIVRLRPADFEAARQLEDEANQQLASNVAPEYYLFSFSEEELFDILMKPDEWNSFDVTLASQLLQQRGRDISPDTMRLLRQNRIAELARPETSNRSWILAGYLFALMGGVFGLCIGWHLYFHRKRLPDGRSVMAFSEPDRRHGLRILVLGVLGLGVWLTLQVIIPALHSSVS